MTPHAHAQEPLPTIGLGNRAVHFEPMQPQDLDDVMAVEAASYSHPWTRGNFSDALAAGHSCMVLRERERGADGMQARPPGRLLAYTVASAGVDEWHVLNLTVAPAHRRQGLASSMLHAVLAEGRRRALGVLWLEVRASNAPALALYARHGMVRQGVRRAYYPAAHGREDAVLMGMDLRALATPSAAAVAEPVPDPLPSRAAGA